MQNNFEQEPLKYEGAEKTPYVEMNQVTGLIKFEGRSIPENAQDFYKPILEWVENYSSAPVAITTLHLNLEYFNTSSSKIILDVMMRLRRLQEKGHTIKVLWFYHPEDEEMKEAGEDYQILSQLPFDILLIDY